MILEYLKGQEISIGTFLFLIFYILKREGIFRKLRFSLNIATGNPGHYERRQIDGNGLIQAGTSQRCQDNYQAIGKLQSQIEDMKDDMKTENQNNRDDHKTIFERIDNLWKYMRK